MSTPASTVAAAVSGVSKSAVSAGSSSFPTESKKHELMPIGRPITLPNLADPKYRITNYIKSKMNIIDILPCRFTLPLTKKSDEIAGKSGFLPQLDYGEMDIYKARCTKYALKPFDGIRIYTTDDTTASDSISNTLKPNFFQGSIDTFTDTVQPISNMIQSTGSESMMSSAQKTATSALSTAIDMGVSGVNSFSSTNDAGTVDKIVSDISTKNIKDSATAVLDGILKGHRISLPSIWSNSAYQPNFSTNIKLVSPYGHYKAIKKFIIEPLTYLLILAAPKTKDAVSYGRPHFITMYSYGLNFMPLGIISNISMRRGGNDTSFNIFRQPLSINITLSFEYAVAGFAGMDEEPLFSDTTIGVADQMLEDEQLSSSNAITLPTVGNIITSLRPHPPSSILNSGDYIHTNMNKSSFGLTVNNENPVTSSKQDGFESFVGGLKSPTNPTNSDLYTLTGEPATAGGGNISPTSIEQSQKMETLNTNKDTISQIMNPDTSGSDLTSQIDDAFT